MTSNIIITVMFFDLLHYMILLALGTECLFQYGVPFTIKSRLFISKIVSFFYILRSFDILSTKRNANFSFSFLCFHKYKIFSKA